MSDFLASSAIAGGGALACCDLLVVVMRVVPLLRPYQSESVEDIRGAYRDGRKRVALQSPTGSGRTVLFAFMTKGAAARDRRVLILVHRQELVDQVDAMLDVFGVPHGHLRLRLREMNYFRALEWAGASEEKLRLVAEARGYKCGWIWHRLQALEDAT